MKTQQIRFLSSFAAPACQVKSYVLNTSRFLLTLLKDSYIPRHFTPEKVMMNNGFDEVVYANLDCTDIRRSTY